MTFNASYTPKGKDRVKYIFTANYGYIVKLYNTRTPSGKRKIRDFYFDQIQKCILCGSVDLGYTVYECPKCGNFTIVPNRCHSRFCSSCAVKMARTDAQYMANTALYGKHRHAVIIPYFLDGLSVIAISSGQIGEVRLDSFFFHLIGSPVKLTFTFIHFSLL